MLAHDRGVSKSAKHLNLIHFLKGLVLASLILSSIPLGVLQPAYGTAQPIPERSPGPRLEVEPPPESGPVEVRNSTPSWVLQDAKESQASVEKALEAARRQDPRRCLELVLDMTSPEAVRLAFACQVALGNRAQADALYHQLSWEDGGRSGARLAAWRGIEDRDPFLVRRALQGLESQTLGERVAMVWADWQEGQSLDGSLPDAFLSGATGVFVEMARAYQTGNVSALEVDTLPEEWRQIQKKLQGGRQSGARDALLVAYDASLREAWEDVLAQSNQLLALYPNSEFRGQAYMLRSLGRLAQGDMDLARADFSLANNFLQTSMPVQVGLLETFLKLQEGDALGAQSFLRDLRQAPLGQHHEPALLFHAARLARFRGNAEEITDAHLILEEAYGDSPWYARALSDEDSEQWGLPIIEMPIPPARVASKILPPDRGPFGLVLWGENFLAGTAEEVSHKLREQETQMPEEDTFVMQASPVTPSGAYVLAGGGSRDTRYLEWDWTKDDFSNLGFRLQGALTHTQEGSALPTSKRVNLGAALHQERDYGRLRVDGRWDSRIEGEDEARARGATVALNFESSDSRETRGIRFAGISAAFGQLSTPESEREYLWFETQGQGDYPAVLGRLEGSWGLDIGIQSQDGDRVVPWLLDGSLMLPLGGAAKVGMSVAASEKEFYFLPAASFNVELPGDLAFWGRWEPRMEYPEWHSVFVREGDWNLPDFNLAPATMPVYVTSGVSWQGISTTLEASGTHFQGDNVRSWKPVEGIWLEEALDDVRGYELAVRGEQHWSGGTRVSMALTHGRTEQFGRRVAFTPSWTGNVELGVPYKRWYYAGVLNAITGRRDDSGQSYGSYVGLNLETTYRTPIGVAASVRLVNLTNAPVRRWPDKPIFSRGIYAGLGYRFGS